LELCKLSLTIRASFHMQALFSRRGCWIEQQVRKLGFYSSAGPYVSH
jgi:hypothetical protein